jgi:hypothetical protein
MNALLITPDSTITSLHINNLDDIESAIGFYAQGQKMPENGISIWYAEAEDSLGLDVNPIGRKLLHGFDVHGNVVLTNVPDGWKPPTD